MAFQPHVPFSGRIGNVVFYQYRGKQVARIYVPRIKQTKATKASANVFGRASALARGLRDGLTPLYSDLKDKGFVNRLNSAMRSCLGTGLPGGDAFSEDLPFLSEFQFNAEKELSYRMRKEITGRFGQGRKLLVSLPALDVQEDLKAPAGTETVILRIGAVSVDWTKTQVDKNHFLEIRIPYRESTRAAEELEFPVTKKKGHLVALVVGLRYASDRQYKAINEKVEWMPTGIVGAWWTGANR